MTKTLRQRQWKCERRSAVRNVEREREEMYMTKKCACIEMNKISRLKMMENDEDDEGMWVEMLMMNTIA